VVFVGGIEVWKFPWNFTVRTIRNCTHAKEWHLSVIRIPKFIICFGLGFLWLIFCFKLKYFSFFLDISTFNISIDVSEFLSVFFHFLSIFSPFVFFYLFINIFLFVIDKKNALQSHGNFRQKQERQSCEMGSVRCSFRQYRGPQRMGNRNKSRSSWCIHHQDIAVPQV
jgi:hypothetical protein